MPVGKTTANLKLRSGPGMNFEPPIDYLEPDTLLEIVGEEGDWLKVRVPAKDFKEGYVGKQYVEIQQGDETPKKVTGTAREDDDYSNLSKSRNLG
jgi:SH3-like domain-containing protein